MGGSRIMNLHIILGNLGKDPEVRYNNETAIANFSVATKERYKGE